jgi:hypothetical protein
VTGGNRRPSGLVLRLGGALVYGGTGFFFAYRALNDLLAGRLSPFGLIGGVLGLAALTIAGIYAWSCLGQSSAPPPG